MAWIPLLLAGWIVLDLLIVAITLAVVRRRRHRAARSTPLVSPLAGVAPASVAGRPGTPTGH